MSSDIGALITGDSGKYTSGGIHIILTLLLLFICFFSMRASALQQEKHTYNNKNILITYISGNLMIPGCRCLNGPEGGLKPLRTNNNNFFQDYGPNKSDVADSLFL